VKISIITPVLDAAGTVERAVRSVLDQEDPDFEHVVVDGGSTDGTLEVLRRYPNLVLLQRPGSGQAEAMNAGFEAATGEVVSYLNADDSYEPGAFRKVRRRFAEDPAVTFLVGRLRVEEDGRPERIAVPNLDFENMLRFFDRDFIPLNPSCYFYRREVQELVGGYDVRRPYAMDYKFLLEAALRFAFTRTDAVLGCYRIHRGTKTGRTSSDAESWRKARFSRGYRRHLPWRKRMLADVWYLTEGHYLGRRLLGRVAGKVRRWLRY